MSICNYCLTPGHITNRCPLKKFGCATCSRYGEDLTIVRTHLSWNCNRHPGLVELHTTMLELRKKKTTTAKVLRTTTDQENHEITSQNNFELTHSGNQSQDEEDENTQLTTQVENANLLIQESEETEIEHLIFNIKSSFNQPMEEEINSNSIFKTQGELDENSYQIQDAEATEIDQVITDLESYFQQPVGQEFDTEWNQAEEHNMEHIFVLQNIDTPLTHYITQSENLMPADGWKQPQGSKYPQQLTK